jgi:hypothetical protein
MLGTLPFSKKNGPPVLSRNPMLVSRKAMLETLVRHLDMVRLSVSGLALLAVLGLVGCTGLIDGGSDGLTRQERIARQKWKDDALPILRANCTTCHAGSRPQVEFLVGDTDFEIYDTLKAFDPPVVNFEAPGSSRILSKGQHDGPALNAEQTAGLLQWLQSERDVTITKPTDETQLLATAPFAVELCPPFDPANPTFVCPTVNRVLLDAVPVVGALIPGAEISFTAHSLSSALYLSNLKITGGTAGAYIEHPLFVSTPAEGESYPDQIDRYFNVKMNLAANAVEQLSGGTAVFAGFVPTDMVEIHFRVLSPFKPDTGGGMAPGGCKVLQSFKTNAGPRLTQNCASCHAGGANPNARAAMDLTGVAATNDEAAQATACAQARTRINLVNTEQSGFYIAPNPGSAINHPFKFNGDVNAFNAFKAAMEIWVQAEKVAP